MESGNLLADRPLLIYLTSKMVEDFIVRFYESRVCVISTYRMLPPVAQKCFTYLLFSPERDWKTWPKRRHVMSIYHSLRLLMQLGIVEGDLETKLHLNIDFKMKFLSSLLSSAAELSELKLYQDGDGKAKRRRLEEKDLLKESTEKWECILRYLALPATDSDKKEVTSLTCDLFQYIGFTKQGNGELEISSSGFQFLLLNKVEQIWTYLIYLFKYLEAKHKLDVFPVVEFFLKLLLSVTANEENDSNNRPLAFEDEWKDEIKTFTQHLRELGLVYMKKKKDGFFFLTPLLRVLALSEGSAAAAPLRTSALLPDAAAVGPVSDSTSLRDANAVANTPSATASLTLSVAGGFLIVETNFRVYAYTNSTLQLAILSTFTELTYRFQNVVVGIMTRDSVRRALQAGITGKQIIQYLRSNAHMQAISVHGQNCIPITVIDQIYLWEQERKRLTCHEGVLYSTFDSETDFVALREFAKKNDVLQWHCNVQKLVVVAGEGGHELVRNWWRSQQQETTGSSAY